MTADIAAIARGLTKAQRDALCSIPVGEFFTPADHVKQVRTWACLKAKRLLRPIASDHWGKYATSTLSTLGLAVRAYLTQEQPR